MKRKKPETVTTFTAIHQIRSSDPCDGECMCSKKRRLEWKTSTVEDFVAAINVHNPEGVCIEHEGVCERVPCCKTKPGEIAEDGW